MDLDLFEDLNLGGYTLKLIGLNIAILIIIILSNDLFGFGKELFLFLSSIGNVFITAREFKKSNVSGRQVFIKPGTKKYVIESPIALIMIYIATIGSISIVSFIVYSFSPKLYNSFDKYLSSKSTSLSNSLLISALSFIAIAILAPIFEEVLFRGILFNKIRERYGIYKAIIFSSLIFFALHFTLNPSPFIVAITNCVLVLKYKSLLPGIMIHMINNSLVLIIEIFSKTSPRSTPAALEITQLITGIIMVGIYVLYIYYAFPSSEEKGKAVELI